MSLVLTYCGKEWRAQRALLLAYTFLVFSCLCLGLSMAPTHYWFDDGFGVHALSWFVAAGVIGVVAFVAPNLVRAEFAQKDDQFVRRLPGALWPAFGGKLLFLVLALLALPLLGLLIGQVFVQAHDANWDGLFAWDWSGRVRLRWPAVIVGSAGALLLVPWVWAIGSWMPGGRMAIGGTVLFVLLCGISVFAVLRQSPGIESDLHWRPWLWAIPPVGLAVAGISWAVGRRGGGPLRSARAGLAVTGLALLPPTAWFADRAWDYHHPDPSRLVDLSVSGLSPDGRFVLAAGSENENFYRVPFRIDLSNGQAEQLDGVFTHMVPFLVRPTAMATGGRQQLWRCIDMDHGNDRVLDLVTGQWTAVDFERTTGALILSDDMRARALAEARAAMQLRAPGGREVWFEDGALCRETAAGVIERTSWSTESHPSVRAAGHGFWQFGADTALYDFAGRKISIPSQCPAFIVRDEVVYVPRGGRSRQWLQRTVGEASRACEPLVGHKVLGLCDDDRLLCATMPAKGQGSAQLFLYRPADGDSQVIETDTPLPAFRIEIEVPMHRVGSLIERDPRGRIWLRTHFGADTYIVVFDPETERVVRVAVVPVETGHGHQLLEWLDGDEVLVRLGARLERWNIATGQRTVLFPRR